MDADIFEKFKEAVEYFGLKEVEEQKKEPCVEICDIKAD